MTIIKIEPIVEDGVSGAAFDASRDHVEVGKSITVGVKKQRTHILGLFVPLKACPGRRVKQTMAIVQAQCSGLPSCSAQVKVFAAVAIDISDRQAGSKLRQFPREQGLAFKIIEIAFAMPDSF